MSTTVPAKASPDRYDLDLRRLTHAGHYVQDEFYVCTAPRVLFVAGRGTGKTTTLLFDAIDYAAEYPGSLQVLTEPSYPMIQDVLVPQLRRFWSSTLVTWTHTAPVNIRLPNNSEIWCRAADSVEEDMRRGPNLARVLMDEVTLGHQEATYDVLAAAVRDERFPHRAVKMTGTPKGQNWLWRRLINAPGAARVFVAETMDSERAGFVPAGYAEALARQYGGWEAPLARQELCAAFLEMAGQVFPQFSRQKHVQTCYQPGLLKQVLGGIDFGAVSPTALVVAGLDAQGRLHAIGEWYKAEATLDQTMAAMSECEQRFGISRWLADPAGKREIELLRRASFSVTAARHGNKIPLRVQLLGARLSQYGGSEPGLYIDPACPNLITEIETLAWRRVKLAGKGTETLNDEFERGAPDHAVDALTNLLPEYDTADYTLYRSEPRRFWG